MNLIDNFLFIGLPYLAIVSFLVGCIYRYRTRAFTYSSLSAQFLEGNGMSLFVLLFHWGILAIFLVHLIVFLFPGLALWWSSNAMRLVAGEMVMLAFGIGVLIGMVMLFIRRFTHDRMRVVTSPTDRVIEFVLLAQIGLGVWTAIGYRWGYYWFASDLSSYLWSIFLLNPQVGAVQSMPLVIKAHVVGACVIVGLFPFTRLVHILVAPFHYIGRPYQRVMWSWDRSRIRNAATPWSGTRPRNT
jgi:nitrate reductase gamma subunit